MHAHSSLIGYRR